jgi:inner membrane transporter RhtA
LVDRVPPHAWFFGSAVFHYLGPSFAVLLFARLPVGGVAWLRIASAAVVFAIWRRPWHTFLAAEWHSRWLMIALGSVFAAMNYSFYIAIDRLPLGTVAAIEFVGPILLAFAGSRSSRNVAALALASCGVFLLADVRLGGNPSAFAWAFTNAALFTLYIVLAHRLSRVDPATSPIDGLGASMIIAALAVTPLALGDAAPAFTDSIALAAGIGIGISSSVLPYVFDQMAMQRLTRATYALFVALLPASAAIIGVVVLAQVPTPIELIGVGLVISGVLTQREPSRTT